MHAEWTVDGWQAPWWSWTAGLVIVAAVACYGLTQIVLYFRRQPGGGPDDQGGQHAQSGPGQGQPPPAETDDLYPAEPALSETAGEGGDNAAAGVRDQAEGPEAGAGGAEMAGADDDLGQWPAPEPDTGQHWWGETTAEEIARLEARLQQLYDRLELEIDVELEASVAAVDSMLASGAYARCDWIAA